MLACSGAPTGSGEAVGHRACGPRQIVGTPCKTAVPPAPAVLLSKKFTVHFEVNTEGAAAASTTKKPGKHKLGEEDERMCTISEVMVEILIRKDSALYFLKSEMEGAAEVICMLVRFPFGSTCLLAKTQLVKSTPTRTDMCIAPCHALRFYLGGIELLVRKAQQTYKCTALERQIVKYINL